MTGSSVRDVAVPSAIGALAAPCALLLAQAAAGTPRPVEVLGGSLLGTAFFAASAVVAAAVPTSSLREAVLATYGTKIGVLMVLGGVLDHADMDRTAFGAAVAVAAVAYLAADVVRLLRRPAHEPDNRDEPPI